MFNLIKSICNYIPGLTTKGLNATVFAWDIDNILLSKEIKLTSPEFAIPGHPQIKWKLTCYPKGDDSNGFVSVFLWKCTDKCEVDIDYQLECVGGDGRVMFTDATKHTFNDGWGWGWPKFLSRNYLRLGNLLREGQLKIRVKINRVTRIVHEDESINHHLLTNQASFDSRQYCEVGLKTDGKTFEAHKFILARESPYFNCLFNGDFKEKGKKVVDLTQFKSDVIEEVLRFIYTGQVLDFDTLSGQLLVAADYFQLDCLKKLCEDNMIFRISVKNCLHFYIIADKTNSADLKKVALLFIRKNSTIVLKNKIILDRQVCVNN